MSLETHSTKRKRAYKRKFDHELAQEMYARGFNVNEISRHLGNIVTSTAIARVVNPEIKKRMDASALLYAMSGTCSECGGRCQRFPKKKDGPSLCRDCWATTRQTRFKLDESENVVAIRCPKCKTWGDPILFRLTKKGSRGFAQRCRQCETESRRNYRNRQKLPCVFCGELALPGKEKSGGVSYPRCAKCYRAGKMLLKPYVVE